MARGRAERLGPVRRPVQTDKGRGNAMTFGTELVLAAALLGPAQQPQKSGDDANRYSAFTVPSRSYEDIEIMRQLLARKLTIFGTADVRPLYGPHTSSGGSHNGQPQASLDATGNMFLQTLNPYVNVTGDAAHLANSLTHQLARSAFVEGVYLDRLGVVFTVTLPPHGDPRPSPAKTSPAPASDEWEKTS